MVPDVEINKMTSVPLVPRIQDVHEQDSLLKGSPKGQNTILRREKFNLEASRQSFRCFPYPEKAGPHEAVNQLWELCLQWLRPEIHTKEQILELLVLEQFLIILPSEIRIWVKSQHPQNIEEVVNLVEDLTQMLDDEALSSQDPTLLQEGNIEKEKSTIFPVATFQESLTLKDVDPDFTWEEWAQLSPVQQDLYKEVLLENYRNLLFIGLSIPKPDVISQLERGEMPRMLESEAPRTICPYFDVESEAKEPLSKLETSARKLSTRRIIERPIRHSFWDSRLVEVFKFQGPLVTEQNQQENHLKQVMSTHEETLSKEKISENEFGRHFNLRSILVTQQKVPSVNNIYKYNMHGKWFKDDSQRTKCPKIYTGQKPFTYSEFEKPFRHISELKLLHYTHHSGEKSYICNECGKGFTKWTNLTRHQRIHTGEKPYKCDECGKAFIQRTHLTQHQLTHTFKCNECGKTYSSILQLNLHQRIHSREKSYKCNECGKVFNRWAILMRHQRIHSGEKPCKCNECGKGFTKWANLTRHQRIHSGEKPYKCDECGKAFIQRTHLTQHQLTHIGEKPFKCNECGKAFTKPVSLTQHQKIHSEEKPFKCNECCKAFTKQAILTRHQRIHSGEKPYKCNFCGKSFTQKPNLTRHQRIHTRNKDPLHGRCVITVC